MRKLLATLLLVLPLGFGLVACETAYRSSTVRYRTVYRRAADAPIERVPLVCDEERIEVEDPAAPRFVDERTWIEENYVVHDDPYQEPCDEVIVVEEYVEEPVYFDTSWSLWLDLGWRDRHRHDDHRYRGYGGSRGYRGSHGSGGSGGHRDSGYRRPAPRPRDDHRDHGRSDRGRSDSGRRDHGTRDHGRTDQRSDSGRGSGDRSRAGGDRDRGRDRSASGSTGSTGSGHTDRSASRGRPSNERLRSMGRSGGNRGSNDRSDGADRNDGRGGNGNRGSNGGGNRRRP